MIIFILALLLASIGMLIWDQVAKIADRRTRRTLAQECSDNIDLQIAEFYQTADHENRFGSGKTRMI